MKHKNAEGVADYDDAFSPVPAASGFRTILSLVTQFDMFTDHVDISQAYIVESLVHSVLMFVLYAISVT